MKIVLFGSTGFIGSELYSSLINDKVEFIVFDKKKHNIFREDTLKPLLYKCDVLINLVGANKNLGLKKMIEVNVLGTERIMNSLVKFAPGAKVIFSSSLLTYVNGDEYGITKKIAEDIIKSYVERGSLRAIILRFSNVYGLRAKPYTNSVIATFADLIRREDLISITGDGTQKRDFIYISDVVRSLKSSIFFNSQRYEEIDICTGKLTSIDMVIKYFQKYCKRDIKYVYEKNRNTDHPYKIIKNFTKAKKMLKWEPEVDIEKGIKIIAENILNEKTKSKRIRIKDR